MRIDAHQHFWKFDPVRDSWITEEMIVIRRDFLPQELKPILEENGFDGSIAVQADQSENETNFLLELARQNHLIKGVVGWIDLCGHNINDRLSYFSQFDLLKGFRHILQGEKDRAFMLRPEFLKGIKTLKKYDFTYDILIFAGQLQFIDQFVEHFPDQKFVIDHIAKPNIKDKGIKEWKKEFERVARHKNVSCKISGLLTEADWKNWKQEDFIPYLDVVVNCFGIDRVMFGSDWPVCLVAGSYGDVLAIVKNYFSPFTETEQQKFFGLNAVEFYNLK